MNILLKWILIAFLFYLVARFVPGIEIAGVYTALILSILWGIVNAILKPILVVLTLPINILTLGLFTFVINGFLFWFLSTFVKGFSVESFWVAVLGALLLSLGSWGVNVLVHKSKE